MNLRGKFSDLASALHGVDALDIKDNAGAGQKAQFQIDLPLDNKDVQNAALRSCRASTRSRARRPTGPPRARSCGTRSRTTPRCRCGPTTPTRPAQGVNIDAVVAGGGVNYDTTGSDLTSAQDYVPGVGFVPSATCHK